MPTIDECACCSKKAYLECCGRYLTLGAYPTTAEALMRSRYTAYTRNDLRYLKKTWHPDYCPELVEDHQTHWQSLTIIDSRPGLKKSVVEFKAHYEIDGEQHCLHEVSVFKKIKNKWVYVTAENF